MKKNLSVLSTIRLELQPMLRIWLKAIMMIISGVIRNQIAFNAGTYNYSDEGLCSWYDFAIAIFEETGINCQVLPILSKDYPAAAKRPVYSVMNKSKIKENYNLVIPHWRTSLRKCIKIISNPLLLST